MCPAPDAVGRGPVGPAVRLAGYRAGQKDVLPRSAREGPAGSLVPPSEVWDRNGENDPVLSGQDANWGAVERRAAPRVSLPSHARGSQRLSALSAAPCRPAQVGRQMDDPRPPTAAIAEGRRPLPLRRTGHLLDALGATRSRRARLVLSRPSRGAGLPVARPGSRPAGGRSEVRCRAV